MVSMNVQMTCQCARRRRDDQPFLNHHTATLRFPAWGKTAARACGHSCLSEAETGVLPIIVRKLDTGMQHKHSASSKCRDVPFGLLTRPLFFFFFFLVFHLLRINRPSITCQNVFYFAKRSRSGERHGNSSTSELRVALSSTACSSTGQNPALTHWVCSLLDAYFAENYFSNPAGSRLWETLYEFMLFTDTLVIHWLFGNSKGVRLKGGPRTTRLLAFHSLEFRMGDNRVFASLRSGIRTRHHSVTTTVSDRGSGGWLRFPLTT